MTMLKEIPLKELPSGVSVTAVDVPAVRMNLYIEVPGSVCRLSGGNEVFITGV